MPALHVLAALFALACYALGAVLSLAVWPRLFDARVSPRVLAGLGAGVLLAAAVS